MLLIQKSANNATVRDLINPSRLFRKGKRIGRFSPGNSEISFG